jgi:hypothetical protein
MQQRGAPKVVERSAAALDMHVARRLWDVSEELTGVRFLAASGVARPRGCRSDPTSRFG